MNEQLTLLTPELRNSWLLKAPIDIHCAWAACTFGVKYPDVTIEQRYESKSANFVALYEITR